MKVLHVRLFSRSGKFSDRHRSSFQPPVHGSSDLQFVCRQARSTAASFQTRSRVTLLLASAARAEEFEFVSKELEIRMHIATAAARVERGGLVLYA